MIKNVILTGDTHGGMATISRVGNIAKNMPQYKSEETAIIILGDAGLNFWLNNTDKKYKKLLNNQGYHIYCVRGNHEERPENLGYELSYDPNVFGMVYHDPNFNNIKYFVDGGEYQIGKYSALIIGGAYSVDKWYRLARAGYSHAEAETADPKQCGWFKDEQLTEAEMDKITEKVVGKRFDFVLSHTCPFSWEPNDLFINGIDQSQVDKSMEYFLEKIKNNIDLGVYCFVHYQSERLERPHVEQFYMKYEDIDTIWQRWQNYDKTGELDWWLPKSENFWSDTNK